MQLSEPDDTGPSHFSATCTVIGSIFTGAKSARILRHRWLPSHGL
jgi:hypothetical protein